MSLKTNTQSPLGNLGDSKAENPNPNESALPPVKMARGAGALPRHGHCTNAGVSPEHRSWTQMRSRCSNPKNPVFYHYGGRGISVCERWDVFENFIEDMGPRPEGTSLDRIDGTKGYFPENCRWATRKVQNDNRINSRFITIDGVTKTCADWSRHLGLHRSTVAGRIRQGWDPILAATSPEQIRGVRKFHPKYK